MAPKVSVCIPAYNRRDMFRATLWSVLRQRYQDFEVIVSDNASEEDLEGEVAATKDPRVRYVRQQKNLGSTANFRFLQTLPKGDYVLFLCSDDLLLPDCLEKATSVLDSHPDRGAAIYMAAHYGEDGFKFLSSMPNREYATAIEYIQDRAVRDFRYPSPSLCLYRRVIFERLGGWNPGLLATGDWELYARVIRYGGGVVFLHDVLAIMRLHADRESNTSALHWGFYHDMMKVSAQPEYPWGSGYRAMAFVEQLLWDWRLKRSPRRTFAHAYRMKAFPGVLFYLPWEIVRRVGVKVNRTFARRKQANAGASTTSNAPAHAELEALNTFWHASEMVRMGNTEAAAGSEPAEEAYPPGITEVRTRT